MKVELEWGTAVLRVYEGNDKGYGDPYVFSCVATCHTLTKTVELSAGSGKMTSETYKTIAIRLFAMGFEKIVYGRPQNGVMRTRTLTPQKWHLDWRKDGPITG